MGLDITAYQDLTLMAKAKVDEDGYPVDSKLIRLYANHDFPGRANGIKDKAVYKVGKAFAFRAGSYGGYNVWREQLAKLAGYPAMPYDHFGKQEMSCAAGCWASKGGPFYELINFADNEGIIGPMISKKLAADFRKFEERARETGDEYFYSKYREWKRAFEMASLNGAVDFH